MLLVRGPRGHLHVDLYFNGIPSLFFVDTGYAGPLVFNPWHHQREKNAIDSIGCTMSDWAKRKTAVRLKACLQAQADDDSWEEAQVVDDFMTAAECQQHAASCPVRLAGIASDQVRSMDMISCAVSPTDGRITLSEHDKLVTMNIPRVSHILTIDYMLSYGSALLLIEPATLSMGPLDVPEGWIQVESSRRHGAFVIKLELEANGLTGWFTIDTGSSVPIAIGKTMSNSLNLKKGGERFLRQSGVNNETTCARVYKEHCIYIKSEVSVQITCPIACNDTDTLAVDGYIGLEFVKCLGGVFFKDNHVYIPRHTKPLVIPPNFIDEVTVTTCKI